MKVKLVPTTLSTTLIVAALASLWAVASPLAAGCAVATPLEQISYVTGESSQFVSEINQLRRSQGLGELSVEGNLTSIAQDWAVNMASQGSIFHRDSLSSGVTGSWKRLGENVGVGPNISDLMQAFIASPGHYRNLVDPAFTHIGVGSVRTPDGLMYTAHEFAAMQGYSPPAPVTSPSPAPTSAPAPPPSAPRLRTPRAAAAAPAPPTTASPAPPTTEPPVTVERSTADQDELQNGGAEDQQQQQHENKGRCRAHGARRLLAGRSTALSRTA